MSSLKRKLVDSVEQLEKKSKSDDIIKSKSKIVDLTCDDAKSVDELSVKNATLTVESDANVNVKLDIKLDVKLETKAKIEGDNNNPNNLTKLRFRPFVEICVWEQEWFVTFIPIVAKTQPILEEISKHVTPMKQFKEYANKPIGKNSASGYFLFDDLEFTVDELKTIIEFQNHVELASYKTQFQVCSATEIPEVDDFTCKDTDNWYKGQIWEGWKDFEFLTPSVTSTAVQESTTLLRWRAIVIPQMKQELTQKLICFYQGDKASMSKFKKQAQDTGESASFKFKLLPKQLSDKESLQALTKLNKILSPKYNFQVCSEGQVTRHIREAGDMVMRYLMMRQMDSFMPLF